MSRLTGTVCWFDATSGEGMVRDDVGARYYLHFSSIAGIDKHNYQYPTERDQERLRDIGGRGCTFERYPSNYTEQADKCVIEGLNETNAGDATMETGWVILDWAGNYVFRGKEFNNFDDAEQYLSEFLGDDYDADRGEYEITVYKP